MKYPTHEEVMAELNVKADKIRADNMEKLLVALNKGVVKNTGACIHDIDWKPLMNGTAMYEAVRGLGERGYDIQRIDSGGTPTWALFN